MPPAIRLQRYLAQAGVAARRKAEELIVSGKVQVNGKVATELGTRVRPGRDEVRVEGRLVEPEDLIYILLNKPKGVITAAKDDRGRKTVLGLIDGVDAKIAPVGRLDFYTEGVLLLTNDGDLHAALLAPKNEIEKTYHAKLRGTVAPRHLDILRKGVRLKDRTKTRPAKVDILRHTGRHTWLVITITEGKHRQIHRMAEALGYQVLKLARVSFAGITYEGVRVGHWRHLSRHEVAHLRGLCGMDAAAPGRRRATPGRAT